MDTKPSFGLRPKDGFLSCVGMNGTSEDPNLVVCFDTLGSEQSNYIEVAEGVIFMEYEFWADFRPFGITGKKGFWPIISNFLGLFFMF